MKQQYLTRLKAVELESQALHPDESLDTWIQQHYPDTHPPYLTLMCLVPSGLKRVCLHRGFLELEQT